MNYIKKLLKLYAPDILISLFWKVVKMRKGLEYNRIIKKKYGKLSNKEIFSIVYKENIWNKDSNLDFNSGPGSHDPKVVTPYIKTISNFFKDLKRKPIVLDVGCGDFNIGSQLYEYTKKYIAIDVVDELIYRNKLKYKSINLEFYVLDMVLDELPSAECILIKEVLQHLPNKEIKIIINKLSYFKYVIITESIPKYDFVANIDKLKGPECRIDLKSGIVIHKHPFYHKYKEKKELLKIPRKDRFISSTLYRNY